MYGGCFGCSNPPAPPKQRQLFPELIPERIGTSYSGISSGRVLNAKNSTAPKAELQSRVRMLDRVANAASSSQSFPPLSSNRRPRRALDCASKAAEWFRDVYTHKQAFFDSRFGPATRSICCVTTAGLDGPEVFICAIPKPPTAFQHSTGGASTGRCLKGP